MKDDVFFHKQTQWYDDLCAYYEVSPTLALELGTRSPNRKPALPGSSTTHPVSGMTFEDIWASRPRSSQEDIFQFYKDQGAWSSFRQAVRHKDMTQYHISVLSKLLKEDARYCEYGCGIAPYTYSLLNVIDPESTIKIYLSDVDCEHLTFGLWRARKTIQRRNLKNVELSAVVVRPNELPVYPDKLDAVVVFEVLEHVPSPLQTIKNLHSQMSSGGVVCENFIKHEHDGQDGPDLHSAALERSHYYTFLEENFSLVDGDKESMTPNATRIWERK